MKNLKTFILYALLLVFMACGQATVDNHLATSPNENSETTTPPLLTMPSDWNKLIDTSLLLTGVIRVYEAGSNIVFYEGNLLINTSTGTVQSEAIPVSVNKTYRIVMQFYWEGSFGKVAFAYVDVNKNIASATESLSFSAGDLHYVNDTANASITADISSGVLPNLDEDGDGWNNFDELKDLSNPKDAAQQPQPVQVKMFYTQQGDILTITIEAEDNKKVESLKYKGSECGMTKVSETDYVSPNNQAGKRIIYNFDLRTARAGINTKTLQIEASDGVTSVQNKAMIATFAETSGVGYADFRFDNPVVGAEIEGNNLQLQGTVCSKQSINNVELKFDHQILLANTKISKEQLTNGEQKITFNNFDSTKVLDGNQQLQINMLDELNNTFNFTPTFNINNAKQIKMVSPSGRQWVFGKEKIVFSTVNLPNTIAFTALGLSLQPVIQGMGSITYTLDVSGKVDGEKIPIKVIATQNDGTEITRTVTFEVRNKPQVQVYNSAATEVIEGWATKFDYQLVNVDPKTITLNNQAAATLGEVNCEVSTSMFNIVICNGEFSSIIKTGASNFTLKANRVATELEVCNTQCEQTQNSPAINVIKVTKDIPKFGVATNDFIKFGLLESTLKLPSGTFYYRLKVYQKSDGSLVYTSADLLGGSEIVPANLQPRTDYILELTKLFGEGGNELGKISKEVTTSDQGLMLWLRFKEDPNGPVCEGGQAGETICDYSGKNNHAKPFNMQTNINKTNSETLYFDGANDYVTVDNTNGYFTFNQTDLIHIILDVTPMDVNDDAAFIINKMAIPSHGNYALIYYPFNNTGSFYFSFMDLVNNQIPAYPSNVAAALGVSHRIELTHQFGINNLSNPTQMMVDDMLVNASWVGGNGNAVPETNDGPLTLGKRYVPSMFDVYKGFFKGEIDELLIYKDYVP